MKTSKWLEILDIVCPFFGNVHDGNDIDKSNPKGYACWFIGRCGHNLKMIWEKGSPWERDSTLIGGMIVKFIVTMAMIPFVICKFIIGNLVYSVHYDKTQKKKGKKTHLFACYAAVTAMLVAIGFMYTDYKLTGKTERDMTADVIDYVMPENVKRELTNENKKVARSEKRTANKEVRNSDHDSPLPVTTTPVTEPIPEETTIVSESVTVITDNIPESEESAVATDEFIEKNSEFSIKRKTRE